MTEREQIANDMLQEIAREIKHKLPEGMGFCLLAYEFGDNDENGCDCRRLMYVSNSNRDDVKEAMKEWIENVK